MTKKNSFAKITNILLKNMRSVIVSQNHYLNKILDVHPLPTLRARSKYYLAVMLLRATHSKID